MAVSLKQITMEIRTRARAILTAILCVGSSGWVVAAGSFVAPNEGPVPFRRDRIPLEADTMIGLAAHLAALAEAQPRATAEGRRASAQMVALALALDPADEKLKGMVALLRDPATPGGNTREVERAKARVWQILAWLGSPEAGADGQALAACLRDVIVASDPEHPRAPELRAKGQAGAWSGWVAEVEAFQDQPEPEMAVAAVPVSADGKPAPTATLPGATTKPVLESAGISTVLWLRAGPRPQFSMETSRLMSAPVRLAATPDSEVLEFVFPVDNGNETLAQVGHNLSKAFTTLPDGGKWSGRLTYSWTSIYDVPRNADSVSGAAAVLAHASFTGREPAEGFVLGAIAEDGKFLKTPYFWNRIHVLRGDGRGRGRLVIPAETTGFLPDILALEDPDFFFRYEVVAASNLAELVDRSAKSPGAAVAEASRKFEEVRSKVGTQAVAAYVANRFVRQRLLEIATEAPFHWSARMLAIQGAGDRPTRMSRVTLAYELQAALLPAASLLGPAADSSSLGVNLSASNVDRIYEVCRAEVDRIERYVDSTDRELLTKSKDLCTMIRSYGRSLRLEGERIIPDPMYKAHGALVAQLAAITSDAPPASGP